MSDPLSFGEWLKHRRKTLDLTQQALADLAHCSIVTIRKIESSDLTPSKQLSKELAIALQVPEADQAAFIQFARSREAEMPAAAFSTPLEPAARSDLAPRAYRVPSSLGSLIGREWEVSAGCKLLKRDGVRLVTLTGPPGTGKTRLSLAIAEQLQTEWTHGACFVPLALISDPALVIEEIVQTLDMVETASRSLLAAVQAYLKDKQLLLVLDNFEQVIEAASVVGDLLGAAPQLKVLVSSREPLKIYGENEFPIPPLTVPSVKDRLPIDELKMYSAIELFTQRAQASQPTFELSDENATVLTQICARLDGLPLAIEMAASRIKWIAPEKLFEQLNQHLSALAGSTRDRAPRQQTLRGAIDWSYDLLDASLQHLFDLCGLFPSGFDIEAMNAASGYADASPLLQELVEKSLLKYSIEADGGARYSLLEMMHAYAYEQLAANDQLARAQQLAAAHYLTVAEQMGHKMNGPEEHYALDRLEREHDNLRAALQWAGEERDGDKFLRLCSALVTFWLVRGHWMEGQHWTEQALTRTLATAVTPDQQRLRANALHAAAQLAENRGHPDATRALYDESLQLRRELNDQEGIAESLCGLGRVASNQGDYARARAHFEASIDLFRTIDHRAGLAAALNSLGYVAYIQQGDAEARKLCEESLALRRTLGDQRGIAATLNSLGYLAVMRADYDAARRLYEESLALRRTIGDRNGISRSLNNLGVVASDQADYGAARRYYTEGLAMDRELGDRRGVAITIINLGNVAYNLGEWEMARSQYEESLAILEELNDQRSIAIALNSLGNVALKQGDAETARQFIQRSLASRYELGDQSGLLHTLASMAAWLAAFGSSERAAQLAGAIVSLRATLNVHFDVPEQAWFDQTLATVRAKLDEATFNAAWAHGQTLSIEEVVAYELE